jgi:NADH-quinone oxidoreductase subunit N
MGSLRQELYFGICLIYGAMGSFDVIEISELSQSAELPIWFPIGIILVTIGMFFKIAAVPFHFGRLMFMKGSYFDHCLNEHIGKSRSYCTLFKLLTIMNADISQHSNLSSLSFLYFDDGRNIMALRQVNVKRILAFSGISHAGLC